MGATREGVEAIWRGAALIQRPEVSTLRLSGPDRVRFLNGMVSGDVARLRPGEGLLAVKPSARGRVEAVVRVRARPESLELEVLAPVASGLAATLAQYIIMDDCAVADASGERVVLALFGAEAPACLARAGLEAPRAAHHFQEQQGVVVIPDDTLGLAGFELHVPPDRVEEWRARLIGAGAIPVGPDDLEVARVEAGAPKDGADLEDTIPMEARLDALLDMQKGCYIGQEVIARAVNLGGVKHILVGLELTGGDLPAPGAKLTQGGAEVGEVSSVVRSPRLGRDLALGYVRRSHEAPGTVLEVDGRPVVVAALPFRAGAR